jgi:hypothetical protein
VSTNNQSTWSSFRESPPFPIYPIPIQVNLHYATKAKKICINVNDDPTTTTTKKYNNTKKCLIIDPRIGKMHISAFFCWPEGVMNFI